MNKFFSRIAALIAAVLILPAALLAEDFDKGPELDAAKDYYAVIHTRLGNIALKLHKDEAPITVRNFVNLAEGTAEFVEPVNGKRVKRPYYNGILFHRVIPSFMIQGGDPTGTGSGDPGYSFEDEFVQALDFSKPGVLAMANSGPATNGSQFFVTDAPTPHLHMRHTIFGRTLEGSGSEEVVRAIANEPRNASDRPSVDVRMERVVIHRLEPGLTDAQAIEQLGLAKPAAAPAAAPTE